MDNKIGYEPREGFDLRVNRACRAFSNYGKTGKINFSRSLSNCFEMGDGDAVVSAIMEKALGHCVNDVRKKQYQKYLLKGIKMQGEILWKQWTRTAEQSPGWKLANK